MSIRAKLLVFIYLINCIAEIKGDGQCKSFTATSGNIGFNCMGLTKLVRYIQNIPENVTSIYIDDSTISTIQRYSFIEYGTTVKKLHLPRCAIKSIQPEGFFNLYVLETLVLRENKLTTINGDSFVNLYRLEHLDISFNDITTIDSSFYQLQRFPTLQRLYFDYNQLETIDYSMLPMLHGLHEVKFGRNPWQWRYRLLLTQQLDNLRIDYNDDWEEWGWISNAALDCENNGKDKIPSDTILDCVIMKLVRTADNIITMENDISRVTSDIADTTNIVCIPEATALYDCYAKSTVANQRAIRPMFEGLTAIMTENGLSSGKCGLNQS